MYINIGWNIETYLLVSSLVISIIGVIYFLRLDFWHYGKLFLYSTLTANILCYIFVSVGFYSFPYRLLPDITNMPIVITTVFPFLVMVSVTFSPNRWGWKIPFYWGVIHLGMLLETLILNNTELIRYEFKWDFWDSYTWWWIYFLVFEWIGGVILPSKLRKPIPMENLTYGSIGWIILHFLLIITIFLGGYYLGITSR